MNGLVWCDNLWINIFWFYFFIYLNVKNTKLNFKTDASLSKYIDSVWIVIEISSRIDAAH